MRRLRTLALLLAALPLAGRPEAEPPAISARFRALAFQEPIDGGYTTAKGWSPLLITSDFLTAEQAYRGPADLTILRRDPSGSTRPVASTRLAEAAKLILLLAPDGQGGQRIVQIDDAPGTFPFGTVRFFNLSGKPLGLGGPSVRGILPPGGSRVVKPTPDARGYAMIPILAQQEGQWKTAYNLRLFPQPDVRTLYFVLPGPANSHAVTLKGVEERRQAEAPPTVTPGGKGANR